MNKIEKALNTRKARLQKEGWIGQTEEEPHEEITFEKIVTDNNLNIK